MKHTSLVAAWLASNTSLSVQYTSGDFILISDLGLGPDRAAPHVHRISPPFIDRGGVSHARAMRCLGRWPLPWVKVTPRGVCGCMGKGVCVPHPAHAFIQALSSGTASRRGHVGRHARVHPGRGSSRGTFELPLPAGGAEGEHHLPRGRRHCQEKSAVLTTVTFN